MITSGGECDINGRTGLTWNQDKGIKKNWRDNKIFVSDMPNEKKIYSPLTITLLQHTPS